MSSACDWKIYRTRFLIKARQLDAPLAFTDPLGREHHGLKGDYLVESSDGLQRIAPREIFEDIYVPMGLTEDSRPYSAQFETNSRVSPSPSAMIQSSALHPTATRPAFRTDTVAAAHPVLPPPSGDRRTRSRDSVRCVQRTIVASTSNPRLGRETGSDSASRRRDRAPGDTGSLPQSPATCTQTALAATRTRRFAALSPRRPSTDFVRNFRGETA